MPMARKSRSTGSRSRAATIEVQIAALRSAPATRMNLASPVMCARDAGSSGQGANEPAYSRPLAARPIDAVLGDGHPFRDCRGLEVWADATRVHAATIGTGAGAGAATETRRAASTSAWVNALVARSSPPGRVTTAHSQIGWSVASGTKRTPGTETEPATDSGRTAIP